MSTDTSSLPPMEQTLSAWWRELLGVEVVKPGDHFLELGGNSLLATLLSNRIEDELGIHLSMVELFDTLEQVTALCQERLEEGSASPAS